MASKRTDVTAVHTAKKDMYNRINMKITGKIKRFVIDSIEIIVVAVFGLVGLIFIFTMPFGPPEDRDKPLWQRLKHAFHETKEAMLEVLHK